MVSKKESSEECYTFCRNSPYYKMLVENIRKEDVKETDVAQKIEDACKSFSNNVCSFEKLSGEEICKKLFDASICISELYKAIKSKEDYYISRKINFENHLQVIDTNKLENMELLYELYDSARNVLNMMKVKDYSNDEHKTCLYYTKKCDENYRKAMDKCLNDNDHFYKALKDFKINYIAIEEESQDLKDCKSSPYFHLPEYDPVLERKQRNIMAGKILSAPLILSFVIPLLYKYTPLGPFLRTKINTVKNKSMNSDEYGNELLSLDTDIEDNISDNGEYNIGYYSGTN
ncbi:PIR Superfamily Protein [Plasmodium ovale curtisi]|uniref:PIR Superfamily Protein n=1 Tax=Plasmodium ovale curtisi TaxID=864141 RepID=A0A1A8WN79_PLAOA|nr:PIR Superfamily Protein [Plasmodium ovale curtisi]